MTQSSILNEAQIRAIVRQELARALRQVAFRLERPVSARGSAPDSRILAVITAAAVAAMGGRPLKVRRVTFLNQNTVSAWAETGRVAIQSSHNLGRNR